MITDIYSAPTRHLMQPGADMYIDSETAAALANALSAKRPKLPTKTAKLLISRNQAAAIECATVAYPAVGSAINTTVDISLISTNALEFETSTKAAAAAAANATAGNVTAAANVTAGAAANALGGSRLSITFPFFETLYYDPVVSFGGIEGMQVIDTTPQNGTCTGVVCGRQAERRGVNGAEGAVAGKRVTALVFAALVLLLGAW